MLKFKNIVTLEEISSLIGATLHGDVALCSYEILGLSKIEMACRGTISFIVNNLYAKYLAQTDATAVIVPEKYKDLETNAIKLVVKDSRLALAKLMREYLVEHDASTGIIHDTAVISDSSEIAAMTTVGANCVIGKNCKIGTQVNLSPGVVIGDNCIIGDNTIILANATIYDNVKIGQNCKIYSGAVIGSDGFGYAQNEDEYWLAMPHIGGVTIAENVEIGANTCIDRGLLSDTEIACNVIIDNLVQIAHNVIIGEKTAIAGCVAIAGSTTIGANCLIGGGSTIAGHLEIADRVHITGTSAVNRTITKSGVYSSGLPARENSLWRKNVARFNFLDSMAKRIKDLEKSILSNNYAIN